MESFVTLLSTESYLPGVLALNESLRRFKSRYPLLVVVSNAIQQSTKNLLEKSGMRVVTCSEGMYVPVEIKNKSGHWGNTFDKIFIFGLTDYRKLVYVDSDMIVLRNIDELFDKPHMSAVSAGKFLYPDWIRLNSGIMVIEPEQGLPEKIMKTLDKSLSEVDALGSTALGDQDLINAYYAEWLASTELHLDEGYNIFQSHLDAYIDKNSYALPDENAPLKKPVSIVHFIGKDKPWMRYSAVKHLLNMLKKKRSFHWENKVFFRYKKLLRESLLAAGYGA
jgi:lipopolysaccharide biosynthesis glycosyltransferase